MLLVIVFGLIALGAAALFVARPEARRVETVRALERAVLYSGLAGLVASIAAVGYKVPQNPEWAKSPDLHLIVMTGIAESMSAPILAFTVLALTSMLMAAGHRRLSRRTP
jgi:hypothetical protein